jgi:hypothetical protein
MAWRSGGVGYDWKRTAAKLNNKASTMGCNIKRVYLLPDASVRFKGMFVAMPQIAANCSMSLGNPAGTTMTIARRRRAICSDQET